MEQFDLSYKTLQNKEISLVVECLPEDMPAGLNDKWKAIKAHKSCKEISMRYELDVIPAGIPTWFIARSHRFTTNTHWIKGALFADENKRHFAQIQAFLDFKYLELTVCGPSPNNFFVLLRDGLEVTLNRYQGLQIKRLIRCPGHNGKECPYEFEYEYLQKLIEKNRFAAECKKTLEEVPITELLFGMHIGVNDALQEEMRKMREQMSQGFAGIEEQLQDAIKLSQRQFIDQYKREQSNIDTQCPNVFVLRCNKSKTWREKFTDNVFELQLYCQAPGEWHPAGEPYILKKPEEWVLKLSSYLQKLFKVLKFAAPFASPVAGIAVSSYQDIKYDIKLGNELIKKLPEWQQEINWEDLEQLRRGLKSEEISGAQLREIRALLDQLDPKQHWGGLSKLLTPEHHYLWLCEHHYKKLKEEYY